MKEFKHFCSSEQEQQSVGGLLAKAVSAPALIFIEGDLGAGKTTLVRGFLRQRGFQGAVKSPTYTLIEPYEFNDGPVFHLDLYRLGHGEELEYLGLREMMDEDSILLIEWPERGHGWLPAPDLYIQIEHLQQGRQLNFVAQNHRGSTILHRLAESISQPSS